jgi:hypothetical protein
MSSLKLTIIVLIANVGERKKVSYVLLSRDRAALTFRRWTSRPMSFRLLTRAGVVLGLRPDFLTFLYNRPKGQKLNKTKKAKNSHKAKRKKAKGQYGKKGLKDSKGHSGL